MNTFVQYLMMFREFQVVVARCVQFSPQFRAGGGKATWLDDGILRGMRQSYVRLQLWWFSSSPTPVTIDDFRDGAETDPGVIERLRVLKTLGPDDLDFNEHNAKISEHNRPKLRAIFQKAVGNDALDVAAGLGAVKAAMDDLIATVEAEMNIIADGDAGTVKRVKKAGIWVSQGKTMADLGVNGVLIADKLDALKAAVLAVAPVE